MKRPCFLTALLALLMISEVITATDAINQDIETEPSLPPNPVAPVPTESRRLALKAAGAFTKEGFRIRDAEWAFSIAKDAPLFLQMTLFAENHYWFIAATPSPGTRLRLTLFDGLGHPQKSEQWQDSGEHDGSRAIVGIAPEKSGAYFVGVELMEAASNQPLDCSLVYAYK